MHARCRLTTLVAIAMALLLIPPAAFAGAESTAPDSAPPDAVAAEADQPVVDQLDANRPATMPYATRPEKHSPMMREIIAAWEASQVAVAAVEQQISATTDPMAALALQRQVEEMREQVEVELLRIQARYARQEGRLDDAAQIDAAIAEMTAPRPRGVPVDRPLPDDRNR
jgi:hypothetical protein